MTESESGDRMKSNTNFVERKNGEGKLILSLFVEIG